VINWDGDSSTLLSEILKESKYRKQMTPGKKNIDGSFIIHQVSAFQIIILSC
jgi:hypothetical protein